MMVVVLGEGRRKGGDGVSKEGVFDRETEGKAREVDGEVKPQRGERGFKKGGREKGGSQRWPLA